MFLWMHADCLFSDFGGHRVGYFWYASNASFVDCIFANNTLFDDEQFYGSATLVAHTGWRGAINMSLQVLLPTANTAK